MTTLPIERLVPSPPSRAATTAFQVGDTVRYSDDWIRKTGMISDETLYGKVVRLVDRGWAAGFPVVDWEHKTRNIRHKPEHLVLVRRGRGASHMKAAEVRPGQMFVIVDTKKGGKWFDDIIYDDVAEADRTVRLLRQRGHEGLQGMDAVGYRPAEKRLRALGMRAASEQQAEKYEAEAEANEAQADADRQKADAARMKEGSDTRRSGIGDGGKKHRSDWSRLGDGTWGLYRDDRKMAMITGKRGWYTLTIDRERVGAFATLEKAFAAGEADADRQKANAARMTPRRARLTWAGDEKYPWDKSASVSITDQQYDALRPGDRVYMDLSTGYGSTGSEREFVVGRTTYSKKYDVYSKTLYPVGEDGNPVKRGRAKYTLFKRKSGVSLGHGGMGTVIKSFRTASTSDQMLRKAFVPDSVDGWLEWEVGSVNRRA